MFDGLRSSRAWRALRRAWLAADSALDAGVHEGESSALRTWRSYSDFCERFRTRGAARLAVELAGEATTLGLAGFSVLLALARPAMDIAARDVFKEPDLAATFLDRYGEVVGRRGARHEDSTPISQIPDYFIEALVATEDRRFFEHKGIDVVGVLRALAANSNAGHVRQGGSSLTQQLAKNLFLSNERTLSRKIDEAFLAFWLEARYSKREILRLYLDRTYMGGGAYGLEAASRYYFAKSARDLSLPEAAMLAGMFKAP
ncbi:MAG: transglycosylase domain-containing protein, partial [Hyphomicrobiales bacterium]|nr:transglycosylase domain-containing protein [Hyphomicrobiales bacterium]